MHDLDDLGRLMGLDDLYEAQQEDLLTWAKREGGKLLAFVLANVVFFGIPLPEKKGD